MVVRKPFKVLVTGGSGFLGSAIVKALLERHPEWQLTILDIVPPEKDIQSRGVGYIHADVTSSESVENAFSDCTPDLVMHTAGIVPARNLRYSQDSKQWEKVKAINYYGTVNVLDAAMQSGCRRFVYTSSCTVVIDDLDHDYFNMKEDIPIGFATLHYGKSKGMAEQYVLSKDHAEKGMKACALRPCTIIGPGDVAVISLIHDLMLKMESHFVVGSGDTLFDFVYLDNVVDAHVLAIENMLSSETAAGHAFFISNQQPVYFWDFFLAIWAEFDHVPSFRIFIPAWLAWIVALIMELITFFTGTSPTINTGSVKDAIRTQYSDNSKARAILGYVPKIGLSEGVRRSCDDYKTYLADVKDAKRTPKKAF
ncbi:hypothetical protein AC579_3819 [Pseudocercospora musae]|uniref:3-beta hydroxysteroid dehydrogenase/isomerase domain-containing protein n=1 Tax=Pseudocercospora musae TaxID=113226 RepID=A0A139I3T2_9PEZI|nr:hypothetical protein AC579_3819 [Pseudocercospora musae]